ncbi:hypothetical protein QJS66_07035 [Kocuria rhizophila]|nr:hypothetical protein QJS66_07035 [Kocuria rhizophila]
MHAPTAWASSPLGLGRPSATSARTVPTATAAAERDRARVLHSSALRRLAAKRVVARKRTTSCATSAWPTRWR